MHPFSSDLFNRSELSWVLLALVPLLGGVGSLGEGFALAVSAVVVSIVVGAGLYVTRSHVTYLPVLITVIFSVTCVTLIQFAFSSWFPRLYQNISVYLPLIAVNALIIKRTRLVHKKFSFSLLDYSILKMAFGLTALGGLREVLSRGSLGGWVLFSAGFDFFAAGPGILFTLGFLWAGGRCLAATQVVQRFQEGVKL